MPFFLFFLCPLCSFAQNEVGPEGYKLFWVLPFILLGFVVFYFSKSILKAKRIRISLKKDKLFYPDNLTLIIENTGNTDIDLVQPLLVFDKFWMKRKFKIKGEGNHSFYPLFLEAGKSHNLKINLARFYGHDPKLKRFPKLIVHISDVNGNKLGRKTIFVRKTFFKF